MKISCISFILHHDGDIVSFSDDVDGLGNGRICDIWKQDKISLIPLERLGDADDDITYILHNGHFFEQAVDLSRDIG